MTFEEGALLEPLSVALAGIKRSGLRLGDSVAICGAGPIGIVSLIAAHAAGAAPIAITDLDPHRLAVAKSLVPRVNTIRTNIDEDPDANGRSIEEALGQKVSLALECTGVESSVHSAIYVCFTETRGEEQAYRK